MSTEVDLALDSTVAVVVVVALARALGRLAIPLGQARVVGEVLAGLCLGPSLLGRLAPGVAARLFRPPVVDVLYVLSTMGLTFYMFLVGATLDHGLLSGRLVRRSATVAAAGIVPAFLLGAGFALLLPPDLAPRAGSPAFAVFVGGALSLTALPVLARILEERDMTDSRLGTLVLVAAGIDDAVAWVLLAVVVALASTGRATGGLGALVGGAAFTAVMLTAGKRLLRVLARHTERRRGLSVDVFAVVLTLVLAAGWFTDAVGIFSVFGGFVTGLAVPSGGRFRAEIVGRLGDVNQVLLLPMFFVYSGLHTDLGQLGVGANLGLTLGMVVVAVGVKYLGCGAAARLLGSTWRESSAVGGLMNARGLMILIFANVGRAHGLVTPAVFAMLVVVALVTTVLATPIYRLSLPDRWERRARRPEGAQSTGDPSGAGTPSAPRLGP